MLKLTEQQQAIVAHNHGPALVFAVAGAGKTTAMVHRIERLVREGIFAPEQLLATSFNKVANGEIEAKLRAWPHCRGVQVRTLHALGYLIVRHAAQSGGLPGFKAEQAKDEMQGLERQLLWKTLALAREQKVRFASQLGTLDQDDFLTYVGACKGNLRYADLALANLPASLKSGARPVAQQAVAPNELKWYLDLYKLYEQVRAGEGWITFDDMLMTGWELLVRQPAILEHFRSQFRCVLVDEFQDINLAQAELLDLLTYPHRNYMAIGDDDQTIYEWRGASPRFILDFEKRYKAGVYMMTDNFRCQAGQVALANRVIAHNRLRKSKQMRLTQGFEGTTQIHIEASLEQMGQSVARELAVHLQAGRSLRELAILVRIYAQTPPLEQALIAAQIPYEIVGGEPFYQRAELLHLLDYCHLGRLEQALTGGTAPGRELLAQAKQAWQNVYNRPTRYLSRVLADRIATFVFGQGLPFSRALKAARNDLPERMVEQVDQLGDHLHWLAGALKKGQAANALLSDLDERLGYMAWLKASSGFPETGAAKAANVAALISYAQGKGTVEQLLAHLQQLAQQAPRVKEEAVTITTIFRAKGLEWPVVFVPNCNQGIIPHERNASVEEERRLLYVAITRARYTLHLHWLGNQPPSQFLLEAEWRKTLDAVAAIQRALSRDPSTWQAEEMLGLAVEAQRLQLDEYFRSWWNVPAEQKAKIANRVTRVLATIHQRNLGKRLGVAGNAGAIWQALAQG